MATRTLYLVRHGDYTPFDRKTLPKSKQPTNLKEHLALSNHHNELNDQGRQQALLTAQHLVHYPITHIFTSTMLRARQTAEIIATEFGDEIPLQTTSILMESYPRMPHGFYQVQNKFHPWMEADVLNELAEQLERAFERFFKPARGEDKHDLLVCHGNVIRYFVSRVLGTGEDGWMRMDIAHCGISQVIVGKSDQMRLVTHNTVGHLPPHLISGIGSARMNGKP